MTKSFELQELAELLSARLVGNPQHRIEGVNVLDEALHNEASFLANARYSEAMKKSKAGVICIDDRSPLSEGKNYLITDNPSRTFQSIAELFYTHHAQSDFEGIHPTAVISPSASLGKNVTIGPYAVLDARVVVGDRSRIDAHVIIGCGATIGADCHIYPSCVVREGCRLGDRVTLQSGAVIGSCGFGYTTDASGHHHKLEQLGIVVLEDDVEIGANSTIDRSRFRTTTVRSGTKIDNLVQIAHNVDIGPDNLIAAQTGIAGSARTGRSVFLGGQVGIVGHVALDDFVMIATRGGVSKPLKAGKYRGSPAIPIAEYNRQEVHVRRLEEYAKRLKQLEDQIASLQSSELISSCKK